MAQKTVAPAGKDASKRQELHGQFGSIESLLTGRMPEVLAQTDQSRETFLCDIERVAGNNRGNYVETIQGLPVDISSKGVAWLNSIVNTISEKVAQFLPLMGLFKK